MTRSTAIPTAGAGVISEADGKINAGWIDVADIYTLLEAAAITTAVPNGSSVAADSVAVTAGSAAIWFCQLSHTDGRRYQCKMSIKLTTLATDTDYEENGMDDEGDWTGTLSADLSAGYIRLIIAGTEVGWTLKSWRIPFKAT